MKTAYLWIVDWGLIQPEHYPAPYRNVTADLFFSSREKFIELCPCDAEMEQLVAVQVPDDFEYWDFVPDNY